LFFNGLHGSWVIPRKLTDLWQNNATKAKDDIPALFNPKLEFYNIAAFMIMNFIDFF
jgi:hypothetical protein